MSKFVLSPYFNSNEHVSKLFFLLKESYPAFTGDEINEEDLFRKIFPENTFDIKRFRVVSSRLFAVLEKFLVVENGRDNSIEFQQKLTQEYGRRNLYKYFEKGIRKMDEELDKQSYQDAEYFRNKALVNRTYFEHPATNRQTTRAQDAFSAWLRFNDAHFILSKLRLSLSTHSLQLLLQKDYYLSLQEEIRQEADRSFADTPVVIMFRNALILQEGTDDAVFEATKHMLLNNSEQISSEDKRSMRTILSNYCTKRFYEGEERFRIIKFDFQCVALEKGWYMKNHRIGKLQFWGILVEAVLLKKYDWAATFIKKYQQYLSREDKEEIVQVSHAFLAFYQKQFDLVIPLLNDAKISSAFFKIVARNLFTRTYFQLYILDDAYSDLFFSQLDADEKFVQRESVLSTSQKNHFRQFIRYIKKVALAKNTRTELLDVREELVVSTNFHLKNWLTTTIQEIILELRHQ